MLCYFSKLCCGKDTENSFSLSRSWCGQSWDSPHKECPKRHCKSANILVLEQSQCSQYSFFQWQSQQKNFLRWKIEGFTMIRHVLLFKLNWIRHWYHKLTCLGHPVTIYLLLFQRTKVSSSFAKYWPIVVSQKKYLLRLLPCQIPFSCSFANNSSPDIFSFMLKILFYYICARDRCYFMRHATHGCLMLHPRLQGGYTGHGKTHGCP